MFITGSGKYVSLVRLK